MIARPKMSQNEWKLIEIRGFKKLGMSHPVPAQVVLREFASGTYSVLGYVLGRTVVEVPVILAQTLLAVAITWALGGLRGNPLLLSAAVSLMALATSSSVLVISCLSKTSKAAMQAAPAVLVPQMLFSGFFIRIDRVPKFLRWAQYACSLKYGINLAALIEFRGCDTAVCAGLLQGDNIHERDWLTYVAILAALTVGFRAVAVLVLYNKAVTFSG